MKKKTVIISSAIILGIAGIGGTATYATSVTNHKEIVAEAKSDVNADNEKLKELGDTVKKFELEGGYLAEDLTEDKLIKVEDSLKQIKDTYTDYEINKDELNNEIKTVSEGKKEVDDRIKRIQSKLELQERVNSLFSTKAIISSSISDVAIAEDVDSKAVESVSKSLESVKEDNDWYLSLEGMVKQADGQLKQINTANKAVDALYNDDNVKEDVTMKQYDEAKDEVDFVKNESVQKKLEDKLEPVLKQVKSNEEKSRKKAEANAIAEAEEQISTRTPAQSSNSEVASNSTSSSNESSSSGQSSAFSNNSGSSLSHTSSKSSASTSFKTSSDSSSSKKSSGGSSSSSESKSSGGSTSAEAEVVREGEIVKGGNTYIEGRMDAGQLDGVPWDDLNQ